LLMRVNVSRAEIDDSDAQLAQLLYRAEDTISQFHIGVPLSLPIDEGVLSFEKVNKTWRFTFMHPNGDRSMVCDLPRELRAGGQARGYDRLHRKASGALQASLGGRAAGRSDGAPGHASERPEA